MAIHVWITKGAALLALLRSHVSRSSLRCGCALGRQLSAAERAAERGEGIDSARWAEALQRWGHEWGLSLTPAEAKRLFHMVDTDCDG